MKRTINPEKILQKLKNQITEAEDAFAEKGAEAFNEEQISELREQVQAGFARLREYYSDAESRVGGYYSEAEDRLRDYYEEVEDRLRSGVENTNQTLRTHPFQMATVTFGVGIIVGALLRMSRR
jgi:ElaB/YqjD/DUF883 family membrane-anchored ribosome-binding protein